MSWPGGTRSLRPPGLGPCPASVPAGTTCLAAVRRGVTTELRVSCMRLTAALTSGLPPMSAPNRPAAAPPSFPCRDKVYGDHTGLRECPGGRGQGYDLRFPRAQAWSDPGITSQRPTLRHAPANTEANLWPHRPVRIFRIRPLTWSPLTESNRRPSPYHGDALPTELRGQVFIFSCPTCGFMPRGWNLGLCPAVFRLEPRALSSGVRASEAIRQRWRRRA
jgi:hypothetical protein